MNEDIKKIKIYKNGKYVCYPKTSADIVEYDENQSIKDVIDGKLDIKQNIENIGKILAIGDDGNIIFIDPPENNINNAKISMFKQNLKINTTNSIIATYKDEEDFINANI